MTAFGRGSPSANRALGTRMIWAIGVGELKRLAPALTLEQATAEARRLALVHRSRTYVYRQTDGRLKPCTVEPEIMLLPGNGMAELVAEVGHE